MEVNISGEQEKWLIEMAASSGHSAEVLVKSIVRKYIKDNPIAEKEQLKLAWMVTPAEIASDYLIEYFKTVYKKRFAIDTDEKMNKALVLSVFTDIDASIEDYKTTTDVLQKAIVWYIYQHNNTNNEGTIFPYLMRILFEQAWLLKTCIESSRSTNLELLLKAQEKNLTGKELSRAIRRGDITGVDNGENIPVLLEAVLMEAQLFMNDLTIESCREFKKHPKMKKLYTSEMPDASYIRRAMKFLAEMKVEA